MSRPAWYEDLAAVLIILILAAVFTSPIWGCILLAWVSH
jgi:uncharacterized membrane protein YdfJ with MMPL/SSD domain